MSDFHNETTQKAKKPYRCLETGGHIKVGDTYVRIAGTFEGDFYSYKMLPVAAALFDKYNSTSWKANQEGVQFGSLYEHIFESMRQNTTSEIIADAEAYIAMRETVPAWMTEAIADAKKEVIV